MQFLITAIVAVIFLVGVVSSCPSVCRCSDYSFGSYPFCSYRGLDGIPADLPNNTYYVDLGHNNIRVIEDSTFNNLSNLQYLWLHQNGISVIEDNTFNNLPNLRVMSLEYNAISVIEDNTFSNLPNLQSLNLSSNKITSIQSNMFNNLLKLDKLHLDNNDISVIEDNTFNNLPNLQYIQLNSNKITSIKSDTFNNLTNLKELSLGGNAISVIEDNTFNNLPNLQVLWLHSNKITSIKSDTFSNLTNLKELRLGGNAISVIEDNTFNNLPNLQVLQLYSNKITSIKSDTFNNLTNLKVLWLQHNDISVIEDNAFNNLPNLEDLKLYSNKITSVKSYTFNNLTNLKELDLEDNDISVIEGNAFNNLLCLRKLHLQDNDISLIEENAFNNLPKLQKLEFDMHCGCTNTQFWRWLKRNQQFSTSVTCNDYDGEKLSNLQASSFTDCFTCVDGTYGIDCSQDCSNNCYNNTCHVVSGLCLSGCKQGWMGQYCKQPCVDRTYGKDCKQICSDNCYNNTCNVVSGLCVSGCRKGWMGPHCQQLVPKSADKYDAVYSGMGASIVSSIQSCIDSHIKPLIETINKQKQTIADHEGTITVQTNKLAEQSDKMSKLEIRIESHEQYSRRTSLRFHNIQVPVDEKGRIVHPVDTDKLIIQVCNTKLGLDINIHDIGRSHVMGKAKNGKSQIIVRFLSYRIRNRVYANKKALKGDPDGIFITENLTKYKTELVDKLSQLKHSKQIYAYWTFDGRIYVKQTETSRQQRVYSFDDIMNFERSNQQHILFQSSDIEKP